MILMIVKNNREDATMERPKLVVALILLSGLIYFMSGFYTADTSSERLASGPCDPSVNICL